MNKKERTEISTLGEFGLIDRITSAFTAKNSSTVKGVGDDAAVIDIGKGRVMLSSSDMLMEGVDFDLRYFPLKHLGYKAVVVGVSDILAMNALPEQITISLGVSSKLPVEAIDDLYEGVALACKELDIDLVGGDLRASVNGLVISITAMGSVEADRVSYRSGAKENDLVCITGNLGAAYMGLHLLERESRVLRDIENPEPKFEGYEYLLESYLKPRHCASTITSLSEAGLVPSSMIDISDGLSSDMLQICHSSQCGARIYLERIPIAKSTSAMAEELNADPVVAALNGGEDYQLLFTVPLEKQELIASLGCIDVIGHITPMSKGAFLVTPDGGEIALKAQGFPDGLKIK
ncbi:MAG: thiamine-phosphate kinase [Rikenellaceae bacterium]